MALFFYSLSGNFAKLKVNFTKNDAIGKFIFYLNVSKGIL